MPYGDTPETDYNEHTGLRLFVVRHERDCDQTPLYALSYKPLEKFLEDEKFFKESKITVIEPMSGAPMTTSADVFVKFKIDGFSEENLKVIKLPVKKE